MTCQELILTNVVVYWLRHNIKVIGQWQPQPQLLGSWARSTFAGPKCIRYSNLLEEGYLGVHFGSCRRYGFMIHMADI